MMKEVVEDYLSRFAKVMTESVYASKGLEDYNRMKKYSDYLDYDKSTLFRDKTKSEAGLKNVGNTCYLNVIFQLLFHVNYLREKICSSDGNKSKFIQLLRELFATMAIGNLSFADPTEIFEHLRENNSDVFVPGVQNDFHQIFTLLIDTISESYRQGSEQQGRFIKKLLFGRMITKIDFFQGKMTKNSPFNIINLDVKEGSFEKGFERWKFYKISGFKTPKGTNVDAVAENQLVQTPALLSFFINRVTYQSNKLVKDNRMFQFDEVISINKWQQPDKNKNNKNNQLSEKEILEENTNLAIWIQKMSVQKENLEKSLKYLQSKEAPLLSEPNVKQVSNTQIDNHLGEKALSQTINYIQQEINLIGLKIKQVTNEMKDNESRLKKLQQDGSFQTYHLWAVMIHQGQTANHGHYKICIKINENWFEYNDIKVSSIPLQKVLQYKKKGEICCLFYRRPSLACNNQRFAIPINLKHLVVQNQKKIKSEIDKARLLQMLYQQTQSANILFQHQFHHGVKDKYQYFFKTLHYALHEKFPFDTCKGILILENIRESSFRSAFNNRLIGQQNLQEINYSNFDIPVEYFITSSILKEFLIKQAHIHQVPSAYEELSSSRIKFNKMSIKQKYHQLLQIIILKGFYYLYILSKEGIIDSYDFKKLSSALDRLLQILGQYSEFVLIGIAIKSSIIEPSHTVEPNTTSIIKTKTIESYGDYFNQKFRFWINQRNQLEKLDENNFYRNAPALKDL